jgi:1-deoxy-D-xylulose-5-phosphate synthase
VWDVSLFGLVPGMKLCSPRDGKRLHDALLESVEADDHPTMIRFSKDRIPDELEAIAHVGPIDVLAHAELHDVLIVGYGEMVQTALGVAKALTDQGIGATVVDPVWALPISDELVELAGKYRLVVSIEDNLLAGGLGSRLELAMDAANIETPMRQFGVPDEFLAPGSRKEVLERVGLTAKQITQEVLATLLALMPDQLSEELSTTSQLAEQPGDQIVQ